MVLGAACVAGCTPPAGGDATAQRLDDREAIEEVLARANLGFELSEPDMFANAFAPDAVYELAAEAPPFDYTKLATTAATTVTLAVRFRR